MGQEPFLGPFILCLPSETVPMSRLGPGAGIGGVVYAEVPGRGGVPAEEPGAGGGGGGGPGTLRHYFEERASRFELAYGFDGPAGGGLAAADRREPLGELKARLAARVGLSAGGLR